MHLPPSIFQAPKQPVIRPCSGLLGSWGGRISKFRTTTGESWKPPSHLTGSRPQQLHLVAVCATGWTASRTQWQSYGQIPTTSRRPWLSPLSTSDHWQNNGVQIFFNSSHCWEPHSTLDEAEPVFNKNVWSRWSTLPRIYLNEKQPSMAHKSQNSLSPE